MWNYNKRNSAKFHRFPASPHAVFTFQTSSDVTSVWLTAFLPLLRGRRSGQVMTYFGSVWVGSPSGRKNWPTSATPAQRSASGCRGVSTFCAEQRRLPAGDLHQLNTLAGTYSAGRHTADGVSGSRRSRGRPSPVGFNCRFSSCFGTLADRRPFCLTCGRRQLGAILCRVIAWSIARRNYICMKLAACWRRIR